MIVLLAVVALTQASVQEPTLDGPPAGWLEEHMPYGADITLNGKVWINTNKVGARDDYAILANDLHRALTSGSVFPKLWIRGYHLRNPKVAYRESLQLVWIDCKSDKVSIEKRVYYSAAKETLGSDGPFAFEPIIPGSIGESWRRAACPPPAE
jgi:hypothetical protein